MNRLPRVEIEGFKSIRKIRRQFPSPEHIEDGDQSAPSQRIRSVLPNYDKLAAGPQIAPAVGIEVMRREYSHFAHWLESLESLAQPRAQ